MNVVETNGARIPVLGLGTWQLSGATCQRMVSEALKLGYRHIDTAAMYGNEADVGEGVRASGVARDDIFITTKVWQSDLRANDFRRSVETSLKRMKLPRVDLILIHWPNPSVPLAETMSALDKVRQDGLAAHIGVSNFTVALVEEAVRLSKAPLVTNQVEMHPFLDQSKVIAACKKHGISVTAYCPIARGSAAGDQTLTRIGAAHGKSGAQVSLRYLLQRGIIAIPRTSKSARLKENLDVFDFTLTEAEMRAIHKLANPQGRVVDWGGTPAWD
jgi:diketogulonate reductase-like aldo/keto reductase